MIASYVHVPSTLSMTNLIKIYNTASEVSPYSRTEH